MMSMLEFGYLEKDKKTLGEFAEYQFRWFRVTLYMEFYVMATNFSQRMP